MKVNLFANYRQIAGSKSVLLDLPAGSSVREALAKLVERFPAMSPQLFDETGELQAHVHIFVNGRDILYLEHGPETPLQAEDKLDIFPPVAGG